MNYRQLLVDGWHHRYGTPAKRAPETKTDRRAAGMLAAPEPVGSPKLSPARRLRQEVFGRFLRDVELRGAAGAAEPDVTRDRVHRILGEMQAARDQPLSPSERSRVEEEVISEVCGLGPLDPLFADPSISDVLVNGPDEVWVDRFGRLEHTAVRFDDEAHLLRLLGRVVDAHGRHLDEASPTVDVRLKDGSRLHAMIPPLCEVPLVSIRRQRAVPFRLGELYACNSLSPAMGEVLTAAVRCGLNMLISGGTGSGKTTLLNVLGSYVPSAERVVTIEETMELQFDHPHTVSLEARLPNIEGRGEVSLRSLVRAALRMRPDRIIVGEVRGSEVFDMLQAMNTGHDGSLTTVHANSPEDALRRLESLVLMGGFELPSRAIRELLGAAFDVIVQLTRFLDGTRRVTSIGEVVFEEERLTTRELFRFAGEGAGGGYVATGVRPRFHARLAATGLDPGFFAAPAEDSGPEDTGPAEGAE